MSALSKAQRDLPLPFQSTSKTSRDAAIKARPKAPGDRAGILGYVLGLGAFGATNEEISIALGIKIQTVCPRVKELRESGDLVPAGEKRITVSRAEANVWVHKRFAQ